MKRLLFFPLILLLLVDVSVGAVQSLVERIDVEGLSSVDKKELLNLLDIEIGKVLDQEKVRVGIKRAFLKGIFEDIEISADPQRTKVTVLVRERDRIGKIGIIGNEFFSDRWIRNSFLLKEGRFLRYDLLDGAAKQLESAFAERGFPAARASVAVSAASKPYLKDLTIAVTEGKPLTVTRMIIHGAPEDEVRWVMSMTEGEIADQEVLKGDMKKIREYYRERRYLNPVASFRLSDSTLDIDVERGKRLVVGFEGNTVFRSKRLMKELPFFDAGEVRDDLIEEASRKIIALYHTRGYAFAQVAPIVPETAGSSGDTIELSFFIFEGEQITVDAVTFKGVALPEEKLKEVLPLKASDDYNPDLLSSTVDVVREFYVALGYVSVGVEPAQVTIERDRAMITIVVKEGSRTIIDSVGVTGALSVTEEEIRKAIRLKKGEPYNEVDIADARSRVIDTYVERGFLDADVNAHVEFGPEGARLTFEITEGNKTFFGKTIIAGNVATKSQVIERELSHGELQPFNAGLLAKERQKLYKLGLFTDVRIEGLDRYDHVRDVRIDVVEGNAGSVEFGFGYSNYDKLNAVVDIGYKNLFGMNRQASLRIGYNSLEKLYALNYLDPWFLDRKLQLRGTLFRSEREEKNIDTKVILYRYRKHGLSLGIEKQYTTAIKGELYYEYVLSNTYDVQPDVILTDYDSGKVTVSSLRPGITYDTRDNPFDPHHGVLAGLTVKVASSALASQVNFGKAIFNGSVYHEISKPFVFAAAARYGVAQGWGPSTILPLVERFFLGGRSTVRGYAQDTLGPRGVLGDPTGGNTFVETNLELRTALGKGLGLVTFLDSGNVWQKVSDVNWSLKHAAGLGLRYNTPVGPLRIDYGYKLEREEGLSRSEIFFSIGQAF